MRPSQVAQSYANISIDLRYAVWYKHETWAVVPTSQHLGSGGPLEKTMRRQAHVYT